MPNLPAGSHPRLHCHIFSDSTHYISCGINDAQADLVPKLPLNQMGEYGAMIQSWQFVYIPYLNVYQLKNAGNVFLGISSDDIPTAGADAGLRVTVNKWVFEDLTINSGSEISTAYLKNVETSKYLKANGNLVDLVNNKGSGATLWNFEISGTVPPP